MKVCEECGRAFDPTKDEFLTLHQRKARSADFCSVECATDYVKDEE